MHLLAWPLIVALGPAPAPAPAPSVQVSWAAPHGCPAPAEVESRIWQLLEGSTETTAVVVEADARVSETNGGYALELTVRRGEDVGTRRLQAGTCAELGRATALIVAMTIDPEAAAMNEAEALPEETAPTVPTLAPADREKDSTPPENAGATPTEMEAAEPAPREATPPESPTITTRGTASRRDATARPAPRGAMRPPTLALRIGGGLGIGLVPRLGGNVLGGVAARWPRWMLELEGAYFVPRVGEAATMSSIRGRFALWTVGARGCPVFAARRFEFPICAGVVAGAMHARGDRGVRSQRAVAPWFGIDLGARALLVPRAWVATGLDARGLVGLTRPVFETAQGTRVHEASVAGGQFAWIVEFRPLRAR